MRGLGGWSWLRVVGGNGSRGCRVERSTGKGGEQSRGEVREERRRIGMGVLRLLAGALGGGGKTVWYELVEKVVS